MQGFHCRCLYGADGPAIGRDARSGGERTGTDPISIGRNTVVHTHAHLTVYRVDTGYMRLGRVQIGNEATIGAVQCELVSPGVSLNEFGGKWVVRLSKV